MRYINLRFTYFYLQTSSVHLLFVCYHWFFTHLNTAVSVTRVTFSTFLTVYMFSLEFLLLHSCGCQLISDEYE